MNSNSHEAHYRTFCIPLFLPPSHIKYSPHPPALTNPQSVIFSWHWTPNSTPTQNDSNTVSTIDQYMCILNRMVASITWTYPALFPNVMVLLKFCHNLTYLISDFQQWQLYFKSNVTKYKLLHILPYGVFKAHSPQSNCFMNTDYQRSQKFRILVKCQ